jgi:hypothetical protein
MGSFRYKVKLKLIKQRVDELASWWNEKLIKLASWLNDKMIEKQVDEMENWWNGQVDEMKVDEIAN